MRAVWESLWLAVALASMAWAMAAAIRARVVLEFLVWGIWTVVIVFKLKALLQ